MIKYKSEKKNIAPFAFQPTVHNLHSFGPKKLVNSVSHPCTLVPFMIEPILYHNTNAISSPVPQILQTPSKALRTN